MLWVMNSFPRKITSLILKVVIVVTATSGVVIQYVLDPRDMLFFTAQSNLWIAVACLAGIILILTHAPVQRWLFSVKLALTVAITLTGIIYCTVLAPFMGAKAYTPQAVLLHVVVPVAAVADFLVYDCCVGYRKWECLTVTIPPLCYLIFAGVGYLQNWDFGYGGHNYPYFFLNWGNPAGAFGFSAEFPFIGVCYYILILLALVIGLGALYIAIANRLAHRQQKNK